MRKANSTGGVLMLGTSTVVTSKAEMLLGGVSGVKCSLSSLKVDNMPTVLPLILSGT